MIISIIYGWWSLLLRNRCIPYSHVNSNYYHITGIYPFYSKCYKNRHLPRKVSLKQCVCVRDLVTNFYLFFFQFWINISPIENKTCSVNVEHKLIIKNKFVTIFHLSRVNFVPPDYKSIILFYKLKVIIRKNLKSRPLANKPSRV